MASFAPEATKCAQGSPAARRRSLPNSRASTEPTRATTRVAIRSHRLARAPLAGGPVHSTPPGSATTSRASGRPATSRRATSSRPGATMANQRRGASGAGAPRRPFGRVGRRSPGAGRVSGRPSNRRCARISTVPLPPATGESSSSSNENPSASARARTFATASRLRFGSATSPPTTWRSGSSNCGFTRTTPCAPGRNRNASGRNMFRAATKLTSTAKKSNGPSATSSDTRRKSVPSSDTTRSSSRRDACNCPCPTSIAVT